MLTGLLIFSLIVIALLAIPLDLEFSVEWPDDAQNEVVLFWAFGLVRARIPAGSVEAAPGAQEESPTPGKRGRGRSPNVLAAVRQRSFRQRVYRFVGDLWHSISKENMRLRACIGLGDPAATGQLWAVVGPVSGMLAQARGIEVVIEPDFADARFEFGGSGKLRLIPLQIIAIAIGLALSPVIWRGLRSMRAS